MAKIFITPTDACHQAEEFVRAAGFEHVIDSTKSEATYWRFPGRRGVLRIGTHPKGGRNGGMPNGPTLASITFHEKAAHEGFLQMTPDNVEFTSATCIGIYMIRSERCDNLGERLGSENPNWDAAIRESDA